MRSMYELVVSVQGPDQIDDPKHCEITIESAFVDTLTGKATEANFGNPSDDQLAQAGSYMAGVLGRLLFAAEPWLSYSRRTHGCGARIQLGAGGEPSWTYTEACHAAGGGLLDFREEEGCCPRLWLYVPKGERQLWLDRIAEWLGQIAQADA